MKLRENWAGDLNEKLASLTGLSTSRPDKYDELNRWLASELGISEVRSCHVSNLSQMWTSRLGQAVMGYPEAIVILSHQPLTTPSASGTYFDRLKETLQYVGRIQLAIACTGREGQWAVDQVVGPDDGALSAEVAHACGAEHVTVHVPPIARK